MNDSCKPPTYEQSISSDDSINIQIENEIVSKEPSRERPLKNCIYANKKMTIIVVITIVIVIMVLLVPHII